MKSKTKKKSHKNVNKKYNVAIILVLIILPLIALVLSIYHFNKQTHISNSFISDLANRKENIENGTVAGAHTTSKVLDITNEFPIINNANITDVSRNKNTISITLESDQTYDEIKTYYDDYFFTNGWKEVKKNVFEKDEKTIELVISDNIIKLKLSYK